MCTKTEREKERKRRRNAGVCLKQHRFSCRTTTCLSFTTQDSHKMQVANSVDVLETRIWEEKREIWTGLKEHKWTNTFTGKEKTFLY